jgi:hypothetical protein
MPEIEDELLSDESDYDNEKQSNEHIFNETFKPNGHICTYSENDEATSLNKSILVSQVMPSNENNESVSLNIVKMPNTSAVFALSMSNKKAINKKNKKFVNKEVYNQDDEDDNYYTNGNKY